MTIGHTNIPNSANSERRKRLILVKLDEETKVGKRKLTLYLALSEA